MSNIDSRQTSYASVAAFIAELLAQVNNAVPPGAGTPAWCALDPADPMKSLSLIVAGGAHVLSVEATQEALAEASKAVAASADWPKVAREIQQLDAARKAGVRIERVSR